MGATTGDGALPVRRARSGSPSSPLVLPTVRYVRSRSVTVHEFVREEREEEEEQLARDGEEEGASFGDEGPLPVCISAVMFYAPDLRPLAPRPPPSSLSIVPVPRRCLSGPTPPRLPPPPRRHLRSVPSMPKALTLDNLTQRSASPGDPFAI
eukprot:TRINITY_DN7073_c0_g1_i1.p1 TRINITY_DN7073_c0_g1~~TRINITY_DN7073_c0_g1_i1.p1  ORF type:complete len:152 (+),score=12.82 TRINITY_DN7073_c0_g1_i1:144-599(+)